jgi:hypothetical protein
VPARLTAYALACLAMQGVATAGELKAGDGYSIRLAHVSGVVYYTIEQEGFEVVATLSSGVEELPIRFSSTLAPGQRFVISVPQSVGQPPLAFEIVRDGNTLLVNVPTAGRPTDLLDEGAAQAAFGK